ncbi:MAG: toprim domain-containing protein [Nanoarchaeota archaeon]|nr:toprim domain-containing protein [Nanoarchaeota archaeon]
MQTLQDWTNKLRISEDIIIVEGKKDKAALNKLGIKNIIPLNGKPLYKLIEEISELKKPVVILTDLDKEGKIFYHKIKHNLQKKGVKIKDGFRNFLFKKTKVNIIESLPNFV